MGPLLRRLSSSLPQAQVGQPGRRDVRPEIIRDHPRVVGQGRGQRLEAQLQEEDGGVAAGGGDGYMRCGDV